MKNETIDRQYHQIQYRMIKMKKIEENEGDSKDELVLIGKLRRWRESYSDFEKDGVVFSIKG